MYYPSSENKGADQLRGYREADLRLCFRLCRLLVFPWGGSYVKLFSLYVSVHYYHRNSDLASNCCGGSVDLHATSGKVLLSFLV